MDKNRKAVDQLLAMYDEYKAVQAQEAHLSTKLAKAKLKNLTADMTQAEYNDVKQELQKIADDMTFANPIIWMLYKYEAYQHEAQPIRTMHDFRLHCSKEGYICTKRFRFLNKQLKKVESVPLTDIAYYPDDMIVAEVAGSWPLHTLMESASFSELWWKYEYYTADGRVAKWENYNI